MAVIPKYETIKADDYRILPPRQSAVECSLKAEADTAIKEVLSISCDVNLLSVEGVTGEARYSGRVDYKALYIDEQGNMGTIAYYADFNDKIEDSSVQPVSQLECILSVADTEIASFNREEIKIVCVIEALIKVNNVSEISILSGGEGFLCNQSSVNMSSYSGGGKDTCEVSDEFEEKVIISKILLTDAYVILKNAAAGVDIVTAEGEVAINLTYLNQEDDIIGNITRVLSFNHEIDAKDVLPSDKAFADCIIKTLKVNAVVDEENKVTLIEVSADIEINARAYSSACISYVDDVFSPDCKIDTAVTGIHSRTYIASFNYEESVEGAAKLDDDMMAAEKILAHAASRVHIANVLPQEDGVTVEGIAVTTVFYSGTENDMTRISSVNVDIPFSIILPMKGARKGDSVNMSAAVFEVEAKCRRGREIEVIMKIKIRADLFTDEVITVLSSVEAGEESPREQSSITIYYPGENERLWDIAKQLGVSPETIMADNPELTFPPPQGSRIFIYRQKH